MLYVTLNTYWTHLGKVYGAGGWGLVNAQHGDLREWESKDKIYQTEFRGKLQKATLMSHHMIQ